MPNQLTWHVGNENPSITENIVNDDGTPKDLSSATVKFKMRAVGSSTLKVDAAAVIVAPATGGNVRYDWQPANVDTAAEYLCWWEVTEAGNTQDVREAIIRFLAHAPETHTYLELEEAKATLEIDTGVVDSDLLAAITAASRVVDDLTQTRFYTTTSDEVRYYTADSAYVIFTDDINSFTELAVSSDGSTFNAWTQNTDYVLEPLNAIVDGRPFHSIRTAYRSHRYFYPYQRSIRVTGKFGWAAPPEPVRVATGIIATKLLKRKKDAPMGVISFFDGSAVRMGRFDPQVDELLAPYNRSTPFL